MVQTDDRVTAVFGSDAMFEIDLHKAGCQDLSRARIGLRRTETYDSPEVCYDELVDTGDPNNPGWLRCEIRVMPCVEELVAKYYDGRPNELG